MSCDVVYVKYWLKNAQILESDTGKPQNLETSRYLTSFKFSGVVSDEI